MSQKNNALIANLVENIRLGNLNPGDKIPSRNHLVKKYGLSYSTVDRALKSLIKAGVLSATQGSGTFVCRQDVKEEGVKRLYAVFHSAGYFNKNIELLFSNSLDGNVPVFNVRDHEAELYMPEFMKKDSGVIWYYPFPRRLNLIETLQKAEIPTLLLNRDYDGFNCITTDPRASLQEGFEWLLTAGKGDFALVYGPPGTFAPYRANRIIAAYELAAEMGIPVRSKNIFRMSSNRYLEEARAVADKIFNRKDMPRRIVLLDMEIALLLVSQGLSLGKIPGRDYLLLMFDSEPQLLEYQGIGMMNQMLQSFCDEARSFFFSDRRDHQLFRKYVKAKLWYKN